MVKIPTVTRKAVFKYLMDNGVLAVEETNCPGNSKIFYEVEGQRSYVSNLHLYMIMKSLCSFEYVKDTFAWRHHNYIVTEKGETFFKRFLELDSEVRPAPFNKQERTRPEPEARNDRRQSDRRQSDRRPRRSD